MRLRRLTRYKNFIFLHFTHYFEFNCKGRPFSNFTLNIDVTTHLFNNHFTNTKPEATSRRIRFAMLLQVIKINEESINFIWRDSATKVFDCQFKLYIACLTINLLLNLYFLSFIISFSLLLY